MNTLQTTGLAGTTFQSLDTELLEFLSLYDAGDEDLLDLVIDEEGVQAEDVSKEAAKKQEGGQ